MSASPCIKAATGHWFDILTGPGGVDPALLDGKPRACPICGEGTDRFTFDDKDGRGTWICRQCPARPGKGAGAGDGVALLEAVTGWDFRRAAAEVEQFLGLPPQGASNGHRQASPAVAPIRRQVAPPPPPAARSPPRAGSPWRPRARSSGCRPWRRTPRTPRTLELHPHGAFERSQV